MGSALTGQLGLPGSQLGLLQLGGPGYVQQFSRSRPQTAKPLIAKVYASDGITFQQTLGPLLKRPPLHWVSNGSYDAITLDLPKPAGGGAIYGASVYGTGIYGRLALGQIVRLAEQDGDGSILYTGVVESRPDVLDPSQPSHQVELSPIAMELDDTMVQLKYTTPTDVAQMFRDAVATTTHLSCDQVSVPASTGVLYPQTAGTQLDFTNRFAREVCDTVRSALGPTWYWFVDPEGRCWLQAMGSGAVYTVKRGLDYSKRTGAGLGGSIRGLRNDILVVGGVPPGGSAPVSARYRSGSFGVDRALQQPVALPGITDQAVLLAVANTVGALLDRPWIRVQLEVLGTFGATPGNPLSLGTRINMAQPGGAMLRFWEPGTSPQAESGTGTGSYIGPFVVQDCVDDGATQSVTVGDVPLTDSRDVQYLSQAALNRALANPLLVVPASLNVQGVVTGQGGLATAANPAPGVSGVPRWTLDGDSFRGYDGTTMDYGAPSGPGVAFEFSSAGRGFLGSGLTLQSAKSGPRLVLDSAVARAQTIDPSGQTRFEWGNIPALGVSPAQWGPRVIDALGNPKLDGLGPISGGVMSSMGLAAVFVNSAATSTSFVAMPTAVAISITVANRAFNVLIFFFATAWITAGSGAIRIRTNVVGVAASGPFKFGVTSAATNGFGHLILTGLAPGSYTVQNEYATDAGVSGFIDQSYVEAFQLGS